MESEWQNTYAVIDDFHKLLQSTARYRVMVFQSRSPNGFLNYAEQNISVYDHGQMERTYLFFWYPGEGHSFQSRIL